MTIHPPPLTGLTQTEQDEFYHQCSIAEEMFCDLLQVCVAQNCNAPSAGLALFVWLTHFLTQNGCTTQGLHAIVSEHSENSTDRVH